MTKGRAVQAADQACSKGSGDCQYLEGSLSEAAWRALASYLARLPMLYAVYVSFIGEKDGKDEHTKVLSVLNDNVTFRKNYHNIKTITTHTTSYFKSTIESKFIDQFISMFISKREKKTKINGFIERLGHR